MASITINLVDVVKNLSRQECQETIRLCATRLHMLQNMSLTHEEKMCVEDNRKIDAIRSFRNRTGVRLKDAKDVVEAYAATLQVLPTPEEMYWGSVADERRRQEAERKMDASSFADHNGMHYCYHKYCPGYPYRASERAHPCGTEGSMAERRRKTSYVYCIEPERED